MVTQLSCLVFGWIRYKRGENKYITPLLKEYQPEEYENKEIARRPFYISYFDPTVEYYTVAVPPIY